MLFKSEGNFELKFIDHSKFEILCEYKGQVLAILDLLSRVDFVSEVFHSIDPALGYPDKINGETTSQEGLVALLKEWDKDLNSMEVSKYSDINEK